MLWFISVIPQRMGATQTSHANTVVSWCTHGEVHFLDGPLQVFKSHSHCVLSVVQVAEVSHDDFCTFLQMHKQDLCP